MRLLAAALLALLASCAAPHRPSCFVGFGLFPLGPFVVCGADVEAEDD